MTLFISAARSDFDIARAIRKTLDAHGVKAWSEAHDLKPGDLWPTKLDEAREGSSGLIAVITPENAEMVGAFEGGFAYGRKTRDADYLVVPLLARGAALADLPELLLRYKAIDASSETDPERIAEIVASALNDTLVA